MTVEAPPSADVRYMQRALLHARRGLGRTTPNPVVGACIVAEDGVIVADGTHERAGEPHAEVHAIERAGARARGATLYCTLEPCAHRGRTGPCTERIIAAGIRRVVAAMEDPNPLVRGRGFATLRAQGIDVTAGVEREAAVRLNRPYITAVQERRPFVTLKAAASLDGFIAAPGRRTPITSMPALRHAHYVRAQVDAIAIGSETLVIDDPLLTARHVYRERPLTRVILDNRLRTAPTARVFTTLAHGPVLVLSSASGDVERRAAALRQAGAEVVFTTPEAGLSGALGLLMERGIQSLLLEGGAALHASAWQGGLVDSVQLYVAPMTLAAGVRFMADTSFSLAELRDLSVVPLGPDVLFEGYVHRAH